MNPQDCDLLVRRLHELSLVDLSALLNGLDEDEAGELLLHFVGDLEHALGAARDAIRGLERIGSGRGPLALVGMGSADRARDTAEQSDAHACEILRARAEAYRDLARVSDAAALVVPRLFEADRRSV